MQLTEDTFPVHPENILLAVFLYFSAQLHTTHNHKTIRVTLIYSHFFSSSVCFIPFVLCTPSPSPLSTSYQIFFFLCFVLFFLIKLFHVPSFYIQWQISATRDLCEDPSHFIHYCNEILLLQRCSLSGCLCHNLRSKSNIYNSFLSLYHCAVQFNTSPDVNSLYTGTLPFLQHIEEQESNKSTIQAVPLESVEVRFFPYS